MYYWLKTLSAKIIHHITNHSGLILAICGGEMRFCCVRGWKVLPQHFVKFTNSVLTQVKDLHISTYLLWFLFGQSKMFLKHHFRCCKGKRRALLLFQSVFVVGMNLRVLEHDKLVIVTAYERFISRTLISFKYMRLERCENVCCMKSPNCRMSIYFQNEMQKNKFTCIILHWGTEVWFPLYNLDKMGITTY